MPSTQSRADEFLSRIAGNQPTAPKFTEGPATEHLQRSLNQPAPKRENARPGDRSLTDHAPKQ